MNVGVFMATLPG